jgi:hypothetical protein
MNLAWTTSFAGPWNPRKTALQSAQRPRNLGCLKAKAKHKRPCPPRTPEAAQPMVDPCSCQTWSSLNLWTVSCVVGNLLRISF